MAFTMFKEFPSELTVKLDKSLQRRYIVFTKVVEIPMNPYNERYYVETG